MRVLIVHAHPEPKSFCSALASEAVRTLTADGHDVVLSDLYAMKWNPRSDQGNFTALQDPGHFKQQAEEMLASEHGGFAPDVAAELDKLLACDALIFQFPLWWFSMPALLKGWVDRVFALGAIYGRGRWYDRGVFAGRRAMLSLTTGGRESMYGPDGLNGDLTALLYPIHHGILRFVGFDVLPPFVAWEP
ncbi:MAG TPA: NAD(P)H-dependent oxidoreductase, partial [Aliidongia sp.]|uniref:NAD(P)H-dependent oxidoreductase n=1 Tax=Aliidongia sp. TaxID=1914230 RepID=UPI002DDDB374